MSKAKTAALSASSQAQPSSNFSFAQGFLIGQLTLALILFCFIKFFIFGDPPSADSRASTRAALRRQRTLSHAASARRRSITAGKRAASNGRPSTTSTAAAANILTTEKILEKTYYNVDGHQPESLDWFNVLIAQTIAQLRADALDGDAVLQSLTSVLNGPQKPDFLDDIKVTEIELGEEFPIFSNCRVIPVDEHGTVVNATGWKGATGNLGESRLQARMDVDLSDVVTLGVETKLVLNYPKPFVAVLPVALSVSVVRFSGTLSLSFTPSQAPPSAKDGEGTLNAHSPTTLTFTFLDDYRLDLSVHSLIGSRSRLQDVPKIAQLVEQRLHAWFDERCVEPRFQQIVLPSLWPRKRNVRGGDDDDDEDAAVDVHDPSAPSAAVAGSSQDRASTRENGAFLPEDPSRRRRASSADDDVFGGAGADDERDYASAQPHDGGTAGPRGPRPMPGSMPRTNSWSGPARRKDEAASTTEVERTLAEAGAEIREAEERDRMREREQRARERERDEGLRRRPGPGALGLGGHERQGSSLRVRG